MDGSASCAPCAGCSASRPPLPLPGSPPSAHADDRGRLQEAARGDWGGGRAPLSCPSPHAPTCLRLRPRQRQARHPRHPGMARSPNVQHTTRSPTASSKWMSTASAYNLWKIKCVAPCCQGHTSRPECGSGGGGRPPAPDAIGHAAHPDVAPTCRGPGRPRKHQAGADAASSAPKRPRGRPKAEPGAGGRLPPAPTVNNEPWKLRRKADLQQQAARAEHAPLPSPLPYRTRSEAGSPAEERRPFRNVEVRKLGPRRRHNVSQVSSRTARNPLDRQLHANSHPDIDPGSAEMPKL